jgi:hypothetical protein
LVSVIVKESLQLCPGPVIVRCSFPLQGEPTHAHKTQVQTAHEKITQLKEVYQSYFKTTLVNPYLPLTTLVKASFTFHEELF